MGSRGRSIRLRIYFLVAIPLITMLGLFGYVAYTSVSNWLNLDRAPSLIRATSIPVTNFVSLLQAERRAAIVYESKPSPANLAAYQAAVKATKHGVASFEQTINSPATTKNATSSSTAALAKMVTDVTRMSGLRTAVAADKIGLIDTLEAYSEIVADQDTVFQAQAASMTATSASSQGLGLISAVNAREDLSEQDAVLAGALAANSLTGPDRAAFGQAAGRQTDDTLLYQALLTPAELASFNTTMNKLAPALIQNNLTKVQQAVEADIPLGAIEQQGLTPATWQELTGSWQKANYQAATDAAATTLGLDQQLADSAKNRVWATAGVGLVGLVLTLVVSLLLSRSINRRLTTLRRSALTLAQEQLPAVVARLRRGESVDVAAEAPPLRAGNDEIGQVGEAIDTVRQTAIRSAVEEANVRQSVNDMFRNLARRNQSLLQRQLSVLDDMERRATDPDVLEDLFKMDHLTTRMRRHAEGLIILSGAPPGRSWSAPVKLIDVMRGAVAEVEDYARVTVTAQSRAALSGSAVTDVIHLLAELIENATTLSPPFTQVRVSGDTVANGFAIEIEDRGLGMVPERLQELNERLANPPGLNPTNTEQLGLFVVGQLARRHGIRVVLRQSPYGGTTAVALIPLALIVAEGPAAITVGGRAPAVAGPGGTGSYNSGSYGNGYPGGSDGAAALGGPAGAGLNGWPAGAGASGQPAGAGPNGWPAETRTNGQAAAYGRVEPAGAPFDMYGNGGQPPDGAGYPPPGTGPRQRPADPGGGAGQQDPGGPTIRISGALRHRSAASGFSNSPDGAGPANGPAGNVSRPGQRGTEEIPVVTGIAFSRPATPPEPVLPPAPSAPPPGLAPSFDVFTPIRRPDADGPPGAGHPYERSHQDFGTSAGSGRTPYQGGAPGPGSTPFADSAPYQGGAPYQNGAPNPDGLSYGGDGYGNGGIPGDGFSGDGPQGTAPGAAGAGGADDFSGLPRRVRQASLAPQLRTSATAASTQGPAAAVPPANAASLADMRNTLSAMQRGWQQGRSQTQRDTESGTDGN